MKKGKLYVGTSGWHYKHWKGTFYPPTIIDAEQFSFYKDHFRTVEINNSFYHLPSLKTFKDWRKAAPDDFIFSVKVSRFITHMKKLKVDKMTINKFLRRVDRLDDKLGPLLLQLPPKWKLNLERLESFLMRLPWGYRFTIEFRNSTWYDERVYELLRQHNCAFCIYKLQHHISPLEVTADFVYIRLHGPGEKYQGSYSDAVLRQWAKKIRAWQRQGKDVYIYFDNDQAGYAAFNAATLRKLVGDL